MTELVKYEVNGMSMVFPKDITEEELHKAIQKRLNNLYFSKRPIVVRKSNGDEYKLLNGVRMHGQRH
ncbi:hypothetical protein N9435_10815 [Pseudomonadales bacterium]|jgi:hypothetical protein|nr:hypothetical protein [Pseudomonadales bacterium]